MHYVKFHYATHYLSESSNALCLMVHNSWYMVHCFTSASAVQFNSTITLHNASASLEVWDLCGGSRWHTHDWHIRGDGRQRSVTGSVAYVAEAIYALQHRSRAE